MHLCFDLKFKSSTPKKKKSIEWLQVYGDLVYNLTRFIWEHDSKEKKKLEVCEASRARVDRFVLMYMFMEQPDLSSYVFWCICSFCGSIVLYSKLLSEVIQIFLFARGYKSYWPNHVNSCVFSVIFLLFIFSVITLISTTTRGL